ncbi:MAG: hemolysin family protein [Candidatus Altiarchaeota archaeon]
MDLWILIVFLLILVLISGFFSGTEVALISVGRFKLRNLIKQKKRGSLSLQRVKNDPERMLTTILIGNNVVNIGASALATYLATDYFGSLGVGIATGVMTFLILVFGEILPKNIAATHNEKIALKVAPIVEIIEKTFSPVIAIFEYISHLMRDIYKPKKTRPLLTEEELKTIVEVGVEEKVIDIKEQELIEGILEFNDIAVKEVMTPLVKMKGLESELFLSEAISRMNQSGHSRFPVYEGGNRDKIVGIVHLKDFMRAWEKDQTQKLADISRKPFFVSRESIISELFREMQKRRIHIAIVINEFGGVEGLVTMENLLEEIVGEIEDESDDVLPDLFIKKDKNTLLLHGETDLEKIEQFFKVELPRNSDYQTVSGLLHFQLKKIPRRGSKLEINGLEFEVKKVSKRRPEKVIVRRTK